MHHAVGESFSFFFLFVVFYDIINLFKSTHFTNVVVPFLFCSWYNKGTTKTTKKEKQK